MASLRVSLAAFALALLINAACGPALRTRAEEASREAVHNGGLNPANWGVLYVVFADSAGSQILAAATAATSLWLVAAACLNTQSAFPRAARGIGAAALPLVGIFTWFLVVNAPELMESSGALCAAVLCTAAWIFAASLQPGNHKLVTPSPGASPGAYAPQQDASGGLFKRVAGWWQR